MIQYLISHQLDNIAVCSCTLIISHISYYVVEACVLSKDLFVAIRLDRKVNTNWPFGTVMYSTDN